MLGFVLIAIVAFHLLLVYRVCTVYSRMWWFFLVYTVFWTFHLVLYFLAAFILPR